MSRVLRIMYLARTTALIVPLVMGLCAAAVPSHARPLKPGDVFRDCAGCPEVVVVPAGGFVMGTDSGRKSERPAGKVRIAKPIAVGRYEVTFDEWDLCRTDGGCETDPYDRMWGRGNRPVINIRHGEAQSFAAWLSKKTGKTYRLPTEAEWEYAARAGTTTAYFWGDDIGEGRANCRRCGTDWSGLKTAPVGSFAPNPWGLYDMHGNLFEHVEDCWHPDHAGRPADGAARVEADCPRRVMKGGAWYFLPKVSRAAARAANDVRVFGYFIGFRIVREVADGEEFRPVPDK